MRFGEYLVSQGKIDEKEILEAVAQQRSYRKVIGQLALEMNLLSPRDVARIRGIQREQGKQFGEIAINLNLLTAEQVESLLKIQKSHHQFIGKILVTQGRLTPDELVAELRRFSAVKKLKKERERPVILAASANAEMVQTVAADFDPAHYQVLVAQNDEQIIETAKKHEPDLIVVDRDLPTSGGYGACQTLRNGTDTRDIPVVVLAQHPEEIHSARGFEVGVDDHFLYPFGKGSLERFVHKVLELRETTGDHLLLLVDDNPMTRHAMKCFLLREDFDVIDLESADGVLKNVSEEVDCIVFAVDVSSERCVQALRDIRDQRGADHIPIVFIALEESRTQVIPLLSAGVNDVVFRPFRQEELVARLRCHASHKKLIDRLDLQKELLQIQKSELEDASRKSRDLVRQWKLAYQGYRRILHSIEDVLMVIDAEYKILMANPAALRTLGLEREGDAVGRSCHRLLGGADRVCEECAARRVFETGRAAHSLRLWTMPGGQSRQVEERAFPILNTKGEVVRVVLYAHPGRQGAPPTGKR